MKKTLLFILCFFMFNKLEAQTHWQLVSSSVKFVVKNAGLNVSGSFKDMTPNIIFDTLTTSGNSISATVDVASINTGINLRDTHLKKEEYFDVKNFPEITMKANVFTKDKNRGFTGYFKIKIKGKTKNIPVSFTFIQEGDTGVFKSEFTLNRLDFDVGGSSVIMSDNVAVVLDVKVKRK